MKSFVTKFKYLFLCNLVISTYIPIIPYWVALATNIGIFITGIFIISKTKEILNKTSFWIVNLWLILCIIQIIRAFIYELDYSDYFMLKSYTSTAMLLPIISIMIKCFSLPEITISCLSLIRKNIICLLPILILIGMPKWATALIYLYPIVFIGAFFKLMDRKTKIITVISYLFIFSFLDARADLLKCIISIFVSIIIHFNWLRYSSILSKLSFTLFILPIILLILGLTGVFNVFDANSYLPEKYLRNMSPEKKSELLADTRTAIFINDIKSSIKSNSIWFGRSPARAAEVMQDSGFGNNMLSSLSKQNDRKSEIGILSIYAWLGLTGVFIYFLIFLLAFYYAFYQGKNMYIRALGLMVPCYWLLSWIEIIPELSIRYFYLLLLLGMCFSPYFRKMTDEEFKTAFKPALFSHKF